MYRKYFDRVVCADGFSVSVQAHEYNYCTPRNSTGPWSSVECGFPNAKDPILETYAEDPGAEICEDTGHVQTVYAYVPSEVIMQIVESHGGMVGGELPEMVLDSTREADKEMDEATKEMLDAAEVMRILVEKGIA